MLSPARTGWVSLKLLSAPRSLWIWELGLEWRTQARVHDLGISAGTGLGESWVQLTAYSNSAPGEGGWARELAAAGQISPARPAIIRLPRA